MKRFPENGELIISIGIDELSDMLRNCIPYQEIKDDRVVVRIESHEKVLMAVTLEAGDYKSVSSTQATHWRNMR